MAMPCAFVGFGPGMVRPINLACSAGSLLAHVRAALAKEVPDALARGQKAMEEALQRAEQRVEELRTALAEMEEGSRQKASTAKDIDRLQGELQAVRQRIDAASAEAADLEQLLSTGAALGCYDLVDATGERKFLATRMNQRVSDFVGGGRTFYLVRVEDRTDSRSLIQPVYVSPNAALPPEEAARVRLPQVIDSLRAGRDPRGDLKAKVKP